MNTPHPVFEPYTEAFAADPYPVYAALRETSPVFHSDEFGMTFVTRYRDIFRLLTDRRLGREVPRHGNGSAPVDGAEDTPCYDRYIRVNLLETEGEPHARLRRLLGASLSPQRVSDLAARIQAIAGDLIDRLQPGTELDFIAEIAEPLPVTVISELLGWPAEARHRLRPWSADIVRPYERDATAEDRQRAETACREFASMLDELVDERRLRPRNDLISALAVRVEKPDGLTRDELISSAMLLLNAGHEATVNAAGNGLLALLRHPETLLRLQQQPELIDTAVEEMLRYDAPLHLFHRFALEELTIGDLTVGRGGTVGLLYASANRDRDVFPEPDTFDISRTPNRHLAFGAATHFCLGAPLARLELRTLFRALLTRTSTIELAGERPEYRTGLVFRGLKRLPIGVGPR